MQLTASASRGKFQGLFLNSLSRCHLSKFLELSIVKSDIKLLYPYILCGVSVRLAHPGNASAVG